MVPSPRLAGGIAAVACANGTILHFVCIKSDNTIGHAVGQYDEHDNLTWRLGDLKGDAYEGSRIAIGCRDPHDPVPILDVVYQHTSGAIVSKTSKPDGSWGQNERCTDEAVVYESDPAGDYVQKGTDLDVIYHHSFHRPLYLWQTHIGTIGPILKDGSPVKVPYGARFNFVVNKDTIHFYFLDNNQSGDIISHYVSGNTGKFYDPREPQMIPAGVSDFKMVEDSVSIIQSVDGADGIRASVRLLETWLNEDFNDWGTFSGPGTLVRPDIGLTVLSQGLSDPAACFSYVNAKTGDWIFLPVRQGQSVGYETAIPVAKGWFEGTDPEECEPVETNGNGTAIGNGNGYAVHDDHANEVQDAQPSKPANGDAADSTRAHGVLSQVIKEAPEWARKFCKDVLIPRASETVIKTARKTGDPRLHALLAPLSKLWDLGSESITFKFLDGQYGGNDIQRSKVRAAIPEWTWYANVTFKEVAKGQPASIKITFDPNDGSWSVIGNDATKEDDDVATMNLGWVKANNRNLPREERGVILHEFGHALGLLHEHQSPAHGSQSVLDPEATVKFYMKDQGWTRDMVMDQVVKTYNLNDVSNFSQVDTKSIMHYYQPSEVTGGDPIDYNYVFSERDKAYMVINYPRSVADERKRTQGKDVTLETALKSVGIADSAPDVAKKILGLRNSAAASGDIDVGQIRRLFTQWARAKHTVKDEPLEPKRKAYLRAMVAHEHGLESKPASVVTTAKDPFPCQYGLAGRKISADSAKKARAVINSDIFLRRPKFDRQDGDGNPIRFTWTIVADPAGGRNRVPSEWEIKQVETALAHWSSVSSTVFDKVDSSKADSADLVIVFQDVNPFDGTTFDADDSLNRSYCMNARFGATDVKETQAMLKQRRIDGWVPLATKTATDDAYDTATYPQTPHDICFRGIVTKTTESNPSTKPGKWAPMDRTRRTIVHELGHFFGLDHEDIGFWCKLYENDEGKAELLKAAAATSTSATVFDDASVMDSLRTDRDDRETQHPWSKLGFKTVFAPSATDISNLALFHCGPHLATVNADKKTFSLVLTKDGTSVVASHGLILKLSSTLIKELEDLAKQGKWQSLREKYLRSKRDRVQSMSTLIATFDANQLAAARKRVGHSVQPRMHELSDTAPGPAAAFAAPMPKLKEVLWEKLNQLFGPSEHASSFLTVQSPARYLDKAEFSYKMEGIYSNFVKPVVVNEAEFRLTDQLYEPLRVVGAPNGQSLSINYEMILNNLVPRYVAADIEIRKAREKMRNWLLQDTSAQNAFFVNDARMIGTKDTIVVGKNESVKAARNNPRASPRLASRMEVCQRLMLEYLEASSAWKSKHSKMIQDAMHVHTDGRLQMLEDAAREIANTASVENSKLSAKYADVVVRGHLHTVRECLAQLDIKSTAEFLQDAKDSLRESALSSLYGASRVLPVIMNPMDWAESLDTGFDPQDLSSDPAIIEMNITAKARQIDTLREQLGSLQHTVKGDEASLRAAMDDAADVYSKAQADLAGAYQESAKLLAKRIVTACNPAIAGIAGVTFDANATQADKDSLSKMVTQLNPMGTINDLFAMMGAVDTAQRSVLSAGAKFSQRQTDWVRAKSATTAEQEAAVSRKIEAATKELESLQIQLTTAHLAKKSEKLAAVVGPNAEAENAAAMAGDDPTKPVALPTMADLAADATEKAPTAGSRWIQVVITSKEAAEFKSKVQTTETTSSDWSISFFGLASGGKNAPKVSGSTEAVAQSSGLEVSISMNCTLVTVDRSSWFQPQFFSMADAFMRNNDNMSWTQGWDEEWKRDHTKAVDAAILNGTKPIPPSFLPCFPTGYIIAKDVLFKISRFKIRTVEDKKYLDEKTTSGGSFLFFSTAKTTQKTQESSSSNFQMASDGMIVRIPGPQVIGYIQQMLPWDGTHKFNKAEALRPDIFLPGDEDEPASNSNKPKGNVGRALGPQPVSEEGKVFNIRSTKAPPPATSGPKAARANAPAFKTDAGADADGADVVNGDDHEHDDGEMDHAMKLITAKLREKLNEPGFLENLLSSSA